MRRPRPVAEDLFLALVVNVEQEKIFAMMPTLHIAVCVCLAFIEGLHCIR